MASRAEAIGMNDAAMIGRRTNQRARLQLAAMLEGTTRAYRVLLRNLSATGAMLEGEELPPPGRMVALKRPDLDAFGTVVWTENGRCGLHFDERLDLEQVISLARAAPERPEAEPMRFYQRPGTAGERLSAEEWAAAKAYAERMGRG